MKKFFRLMNEADENLTESAPSDSASSNNYFSDDTPLDSSINESMKEMGLDPSKYGLEAKSDNDSLEEDSQGSDEVQEDAPVKEESSYLEQVNSLGAIHNDTAIKIESPEQLKELIQKGHDYTQKTQSLSEERKAWDSEKSGAESELNAAIQEFNTKHAGLEKQLQEMEQWTFTLNQLEQNAPDLFEEVQRAYEGTVKQFTNPVLDKQLASIRAELAETKKGLTSRENELILDKFEIEKKEMAATEQSLKELGINVDWKEVEKQWAQTGLPVKQVVGSLYFENVTKAQASKSKVADTAKKVAAKPTGAASVSRPGNKVQQVDSKLSHYDYARELLHKYKQN